MGLTLSSVTRIKAQHQPAGWAQSPHTGRREHCQASLTLVKRAYKACGGQWAARGPGCLGDEGMDRLLGETCPAGGHWVTLPAPQFASDPGSLRGLGRPRQGRLARWIHTVDLFSCQTPLLGSEQERRAEAGSQKPNWREGCFGKGSAVWVVMRLSVRCHDLLSLSEAWLSRVPPTEGRWQMDRTFSPSPSEPVSKCTEGLILGGEHTV